MKESLYPEYPILIIDDEAQFLYSCELTLKLAMINNVITCNDSRRAISLIKKYGVRVVLLDLSMPHIGGEEILDRIVREHPDVSVIIVTGDNEIDTAIKCMKLGAFDYLLKPVEENRLVTNIRRIIEYLEIKKENIELKKTFFSNKLQNPEAFKEIITRNPEMIKILHYIESIAITSEPILITGETGVGKELVAKALHILSGRKGTFVTVNVAGLDDQMFTDTLFGHKKGAFTDAIITRQGLLEKAQGGTLLLDEIGDLSISSQTKLLRLLQENEYYPLGMDEPSYSTAQIIVSTNKDLFLLQDVEKFRNDLFYRLNVHHIQLPRLKDRLEDLPLLISHFINEACKDLNKKTPTLPSELLTLLQTYHFPGNIRELRAMIYNAISTHKSKILSLSSFKQAISTNRFNKGEKRNSHIIKDKDLISFSDQLPTLKEIQNILIDEALKRSGNNQSIAACMLGISRQALCKRLKNKE